MCFEPVCFKLLMATRNRGKVEELKSLLEGVPLEILTMLDFPGLPEAPEEHDTFRENAAQKALLAARETGLTALADDSGLEVDALGGQPGVKSARFAGEPADDHRNNRQLLSMLKGVPAERRQARFVSVIAIATPEGELNFAQGECEGIILEEMRGTGGFGYDPLFYLPEKKKTFAELTLEEKNLISHRGKALREAVTTLRRLIPS